MGNIRKRRKKKNNNRRMERRTTFKRLFFKRWLRLFFWIFAVLIILTFITCSYMQVIMLDQYYFAENHVESSVYKVYTEMTMNGADLSDDETMDRFRTNIRYYCSTMEGFTAAIYDNDSMEFICDSHKAGFLLEVRPNPDTGGDDILHYECPIDVMPEYAELYDKILYESMEMQPKIDYELYDVYIKADEFVPGLIRINEYESDGTIKSQTYYDYAPENVDDYEHIELSSHDEIYEKNASNGSRFFGIVVAGSESGSYTEEVLNEQIALYMSERSDEMEGTYYEEYGAFSSTIIGCNVIDMGDGKEFVLFSAMHYDIFEYLGKEILAVGIAYGIGFVLSLVIALISSRISWLKLKARYDMEDYRKSMTNAMAHDLKSPLMAISGYAENLKNNVHTEKRDYYAEAIADNVHYMNHIIENVLELAKVEDGSMRLNIVSVSIPKLVQEIATKYEVAMENRDISIHVSGQMELDADRSMMIQVLDNLIGNAVKYCLDGGCIEIECDKAAFTIKNPCEMIDSDKVKAVELWKPFVKGDNSRSEKKGSGIGLTIAKNILEMHGYTLEIAYEEESFCVKVRV